MPLKKSPLTIRRCPTPLHAALKQSAQRNKRSLNNEALVWLEQQAAAEKPRPAKEFLPALEAFYDLQTPAERKEFADAVTALRRRHAHEHLS